MVWFGIKTVESQNQAKPDETHIKQEVVYYKIMLNRVICGQTKEIKESAGFRAPSHRPGQQ